MLFFKQRKWMVIYIMAIKSIKKALSLQDKQTHNQIMLLYKSCMSHMDYFYGAFWSWGL